MINFSIQLPLVSQTDHLLHPAFHRSCRQSFIKKFLKHLSQRRDQSPMISARFTFFNDTDFCLAAVFFFLS